MMLTDGSCIVNIKRMQVLVIVPTAMLVSPDLTTMLQNSIP
jgi:hypothetical protein